MNLPSFRHKVGSQELWLRPEDSGNLLLQKDGLWNAMSETLDMHRLKAEHLLRRARLAALGESFVILTLLVWLSLEYQNNRYMQLWFARNFWPAQWLLNGMDAGNLARKTIQGTEDPGRSKEDSVKRKQAELKPSFLWEGTTILIWHGSGELDLRARAVVPSAWMIPLVDDRLERTP